MMISSRPQDLQPPGGGYEDRREEPYGNHFYQHRPPNFDSRVVADEFDRRQSHGSGGNLGRRDFKQPIISGRGYEFEGFVPLPPPHVSPFPGHPFYHHTPLVTDVRGEVHNDGRAVFVQDPVGERPQRMRLLNSVDVRRNFTHVSFGRL